VKSISLDRAAKPIKDFVRTLPVEPDGSVLKLRGKAVLRVLPVVETVDRRRLKAAILKRRSCSRKLNEEWRLVDQAMWDRLPEE
jgi:hypothetical protein